MSKEEKILSTLNDDHTDVNKPLSDREIASLIKASQHKNFNTVELKVKKENNNNFRKLSLHEIAKQVKDTTVQESEIQHDIEKKDNKEVDNKIDNKEEISKQLNDKNKDKNDKNKDINDKDKSFEKDATTSEEQDSKEEETEKKEKTLKEEEHLNILEEAKNNEYQRGKNDAFSEIKEGSEAAIAQFKKIIENISKVEKFDLENLENLISDKVLELSSDLSGKIIKALPADFTNKIKKFISQLENIEGSIDVYINDKDFEVLDNDKNIKKEIKKLRLFAKKELKHGEIELEVNGIKISQKL